MASKNIRAFFAIPIPEFVFKQVGDLQQTMEKDMPGLFRWVKPHQIHLTLKFFSEFKTDQIVPCQLELKKSFSQQKKLDLKIIGIGAFPHVAKPKVLWLGLNNHSHIYEIHQLIEKTSSRIGYANDKKAFFPHITIGRINKYGKGEDISIVKKFIDDDFQLAKGIFPADRISFIESELTPSGPNYSEIFGIPFSA